MAKVNIYIHTSIKNVRPVPGSWTYILEYFLSTGNPETRTKEGTFEAETAITAALKTLIMALKRLTKTCEVNVYTDCIQLETGAKDWIWKWRMNGWKNSQGKEVANKEDWQELADLLERHDVSFVIGAAHSYKKWMTNHVQELETERKAKNV